MGEQMMFPEKWEDFVSDYSFKDKEKIYTNGSELIQVFRVEQMMEHYHGKTCTMEHAGTLDVKTCGVWFCSECGSPIYNDVTPYYCLYCGCEVEH